MLRILCNESADGRRWTLCGQLAGPWVTELLEEWKRRRGDSPGLELVIDLSDVTFIDEAGEGVLREMRDQGVEFVAKGVETRHTLENLATREKPQLRRFVRPPRDGCCP
jgi:anti-anti-sigma regulatory factor